jgi:hypothetical protein
MICPQIVDAQQADAVLALPTMGTAMPWRPLLLCPGLMRRDERQKPQENQEAPEKACKPGSAPGAMWPRQIAPF